MRTYFGLETTPHPAPLKCEKSLLETQLLCNELLRHETPTRTIQKLLQPSFSVALSQSLPIYRHIIGLETNTPPTCLKDMKNP